MPATLSVNLDKIALIRNSRPGDAPRLLDFAALLLDAGAAGLTAHCRPDQRHIRTGDIPALAALCRERDREFNLEGNPFEPTRGGWPGYLELAEKTPPHQCTLVPDATDALTSDAGFALSPGGGGRLAPLIARLKKTGARVSLFVNAGDTGMDIAKKAGTDAVEIYTGPYATAPDAAHRARELDKVRQSAEAAQQAGLRVHAGHDLNCGNLPELLRAVPGIAEVSIGHALVIDALRKGMARAVRDYLDCLSAI